MARSGYATISATERARDRLQTLTLTESSRVSKRLTMTTVLEIALDVVAEHMPDFQDHLDAHLAEVDT